MIKHSPEPGAPAITVVVVKAYELVAMSTPGAISVKLPTGTVYHQPSKGGGRLQSAALLAVAVGALELEVSASRADPSFQAGSSATP
jgi:hypothetical protein